LQCRRHYSCLGIHACYSGCSAICEKGSAGRIG
jgi:hypothetical protein